jgi:hypothetical protein
MRYMVSLEAIAALLIVMLVACSFGVEPDW